MAYGDFTTVVNDLVDGKPAQLIISKRRFTKTPFKQAAVDAFTAKANEVARQARDAKPRRK